jgi:mannan endo-1,4-beta-mannosidase
MLNPGSVWFQSFTPGSTPEINTGPLGLQRLDYVVKAAESRGIKLVVPFVNNWDDYGGMTAYMPYCLNITSTASDIQATGDKSLWYTIPKCQEQYQKYIQTVVSRYLDSPAIFAWELVNEPRCTGCNTSVITEWARKTSAYIKSLDKKHMVAVGDEGFGLKATGEGTNQYPYEFYEGTDFVSLVGLPDIDMGTFHLYPDHCKFVTVLI